MLIEMGLMMMWKMPRMMRGLRIDGLWHGNKLVGFESHERRYLIRSGRIGCTGRIRTTGKRRELSSGGGVRVGIDLHELMRRLWLSGARRGERVIEWVVERRCCYAQWLAARCVIAWVVGWCCAWWRRRWYSGVH